MPGRRSQSQSRLHRTDHVNFVDRTGFHAASARHHRLSRRRLGLGVLEAGATIGAAPLAANGHLSSRRGLGRVRIKREMSAIGGWAQPVDATLYLRGAMEWCFEGSMIS